MIKQIYFALIQGIIGVVFIYIIAVLTDAVQIINIWLLIIMYVILNFILNLIIPGRWK